MLAEQDFAYICDLVRDRAAIVLEPGKEYLAETRLDPVVRRAGLGSVSELVATLREDDDPDLSEQVVDALTTNETSFFRDVYPFESLRTHVLPDLIERKRLSRSLFIWSAGCSSGQEPYSVAMLIREDFPELADWQVSILGTDVSVAMLEQARAGRYGQIEVNRGLPAHLLVKYFRRAGVGWQIDASIRSMVRFRHQNLVGGWPSIPPMDLVLMRNVMIYFDLEAKQQLLARVRDVLAPHGYLLLGTSETTLHLDDTFRRHAVGPTGWYRTKRKIPERTGARADDQGSVRRKAMEFSKEDLGQIVTDIWSSMLGFPVEPRGEPVTVNGTRHLSASVQISGGWDGTVLVSCAEDLARKVAASMFDSAEDATSDDEIRDALGEVANMTAGNVKALVESYCRLSLPMVAEGRELAISIPGSRVIAEASFDCAEAPLTVEVYEKA